MKKYKLKDKLLYVGVITFLSITLIESMFEIHANLVHFIKGLAVGLQMVGVVVLLTKKKVNRSLQR